MKVSYGSPGQRGVTHLVAVGADEDPACDPMNQNLMLASAGVVIVAGLMGMSTVRNIGIGAVFALLAQRELKKSRKIEVTQPTGRW